MLLISIKWSIGDGSIVNLWTDWWCGNVPLIQQYPDVQVDMNMKVRDIIDDYGKLEPIAHLISDHMIEDILNIHINFYSHSMDRPSWVGSANGMFSVSAAYDLINKEDTDLKGWKWIWKLKIPQKLKGFVWLIRHNSLPTNHLRAHIEELLWKTLVLDAILVLRILLIYSVIVLKLGRCGIVFIITVGGEVFLIALLRSGSSPILCKKVIRD